MTFTDDDIKRLKEANREGFYEYFKMEALLDRLEAAEDLAKHDHCGCSGRIDLEEIWRKAADK